MKSNVYTGFLKVVFISALLAFFTTLIYIKIPPFYITSVNVAIVPNFEDKDTQYNYNGFYQGEASKNIVGSLALFAAETDFKKSLEQNLNYKILYLLSKTTGSNIVTLKVVTPQKPNTQVLEEVTVSKLELALKSFLPENLQYKINVLRDFNFVTKAGISNYQFFTIVFGTYLIFVSLFSLAGEYYKSSK